MKYLCRIALLLMIGCAPAFGQLYPVRHYTVREGLPNMQIASSLLDSRGYLWLGTTDGLAKFDGDQFEQFDRHDLSLGSAYIQGIGEDSRKHIWIMTREGLTSFDGASFKHFPFPDHLTLNNTPLQIDDQDRIWFVASDRLYQFQHGTYRKAAQTVAGVDSLVVTSLRWDKTGKRLWLTAGPESGGLYFIVANRCFRISDYAPPAGFQAHLMQGYTQVILREANQLGASRYLTAEPGQTPVPFLAINRGTGQALAPFSGDFYCLDNPSGSFFRYSGGSRTVTVIHRSPGNLAYTAPVVRNGKVYFGTDKGLVEVFDNGLRYFDEQQVPYVWSVAERPDGNIWLLNYGTPPQRYSRTGEDNGMVSPLQAPWLRNALSAGRPDKQTLWDRYYYHPVQDHSGLLYLPHETGPLVFDGRDAHFLTRPEDGTALFCYHDPRTDRVFVGMPGGFRVYRQGRLIRKITAKQGLHSCLYGLSAIAANEPDVYWLGTGMGLARYHFGTQQVVNYTETQGVKPAMAVTDLCEDTRGTIWLATRDGFGYIDRSTRQVVRIAAGTFRSKAAFVGMLTDSVLAIGETRGVFLFDLATWYRQKKVVLQLLNHRTGYPGIQPGQAGFYKDRQGRAWITSGTVLCYIDTKRFGRRPEPLLPVIRKLNGQRLPFSYGDTVFSLTGRQHGLTAELEVLGDNRPAQTQYAWQLDDQPWSDWQTAPVIQLHEYGSGAHTLRVKARTGGLHEVHEQLTALHFRADMAFYETPVFRKIIPYLLAGALLTGGLLLWFVIRGRQQVNLANRQLREREKESLFLSVQTIQAQLNTHFMFNVLVPLQNLILKNKPDEAAGLLVEFSNLVRSFLNTSAVTGSRRRNQRLAEREITLAEEMNLLSSYVRFEQLLYRDKITVHFDAGSLDGKLNPETVTLPPMLIQPFVENAIKHGLVHKTGPGNLWIRFIGLGETLVCIVEDDGIGREQMRQIHQYSQRAYRSLGATLVQQRVDTLNLLGYSIKVQTDDRLAGGTVVTITIARSEDR
nr:two-component regulator propeller domain-containing protein [uncultured Arsenicibacter sp.]